MKNEEFRFCGDFVHLLAFCVLIRTIYSNRSCAGISGKTQLLIATVFTFRYLDVVTTYISIYNTLFKITYIVLAYFTLYLIFVKFRRTYDSENDSFWNTFIILSVCVLTCFVNNISLNSKKFDVVETIREYIKNPLELAWTFSIYLEALAIIPQLYMLRNTGDGQNILQYIWALAVYRGLYICNWIYRYFDENHLDLISSVSGTVQTSLLVIVLIYIQKCKKRKTKWQQITKVFTIAAAKLGYSKKSQPPSFPIDKAVNEVANNLIL